MAVPGDSPLISPVGVTEATAGLLELQVGVNVVFQGKISIEGRVDHPAMRFMFPPAILMDSGWIVDVVTVISMVSVRTGLLPALAVMIAVPGILAVTNPVKTLTEATAGLLELHDG
jgi:hypothetical protein